MGRHCLAELPSVPPHRATFRSFRHILMPYPRRPERTVQMVIRIPETLHAELHSLLVNPATGRIKFGTWTRTIENLIREYVDSQKLVGYGTGQKAVAKQP